MSGTRKGPVLFDLEPEASEAPPSRRAKVIDAGNRAEARATSIPNPADADPVPDAGPDLPDGRAMQTLAALGARRRSALGRWFWRLLGAVVVAFASLAAWDFVAGLFLRNQWLGGSVAALLGAFLLVCVLIGLREAAAFARLGRVDGMQRDALAAMEADDLKAARRVTDRLLGLYAARPDTAWGRAKLVEGVPDQLDAVGLLTLAEAEVLAPLDAAALREVEAAARQVATVTALVPLALADVAAAGTANLRMIRRISEVYGGRSGTLATWRLTRAVLTHLVATGAVAVGDDMLEPILGAGLLGKLSRRFGEGMVNGALTARVGIAAMEVCRPLPFTRNERPSLRATIARALAGLVRRG